MTDSPTGSKPINGNRAAPGADAPAVHHMGDAQEAREYFTAERCSEALPREMRLDERGRPIITGDPAGPRTTPPAPQR